MGLRRLTKRTSLVFEAVAGRPTRFHLQIVRQQTCPVGLLRGIGIAYAMAVMESFLFTLSRSRRLR